LNIFNLYFFTGWNHIISPGALDHILFIVALTAIYTLKNWKQVLILVTAFTIGHSITLALSVYDVIRFSGAWVEFLIPCTIIITALFNLAVKNFEARSLRLNYFLALFFGLVHGMGFANTIRFMLAKNEQIAMPLFSFNVGLEAGQIALVLSILLTAYLVVDKLKFNRRWWVWALSSLAFFVAVQMAIERWP
jgi:HupE / UreJ protein